MAYVKKKRPEVEGEGQQTRFMASQGPGMVGGLGAEGGRGLAGGSPSSTPFINPQEYLGQNVQAGQRLARRIGESFTRPAGEISEQIGREKTAFETQANQSPLSYLDGLYGQTGKTPLSLTGENISTLGERLGTQYEGPKTFNPSEKVTSPLQKLRERIKLYGVQGGDKATGIQQEGLRQSLIGEVMQPTSVGGKRSLEELLLTGQPGALKTLQDIIAGTGSQIGQGQYPSPMARLNESRDELSKLVKSREDEARDTRESARTSIGTGIGTIQENVGSAVSKAIEDANARKAMIPELFRDKYTTQEQDLARRLGISDEERKRGQGYMQGLLDPYGNKGFLSSDEFSGDEISGLDYSQIDPFSNLFTQGNPDLLYTPESMISSEQSDILSQLQGLLGVDPSISRAEGALGGEARSIQTGDVGSWLDDLARMEQDQRALAESRRTDKFEAGFEEAFTGGGGKLPEDEESLRDQIERLRKETSENEKIKVNIDLHNRLDEDQKALDQAYAEGVDESEVNERQAALDNVRLTLGERPGILDELRSLAYGDWGRGRLGSLEEKRDRAVQKRAQDLARKRAEASGRNTYTDPGSGRTWTQTSSGGMTSNPGQNVD